MTFEDVKRTAEGGFFKAKYKIMKLIQNTIFSIVSMFMGAFVMFIHFTDKYDYHINLDHNNIHILTDEGIKHTIHADSLAQFIIKDNL